MIIIDWDFDVPIDTLNPLFKLEKLKHIPIKKTY
jgi:hypothetical protein